MSQKKSIKNVIKHFNFKKVNSVMIHLNWKWSTINSVPTILQLQEQAKRLLKEVCKYNDFTEISTGGFTAYKNEEEIGLRFDISDWSEQLKK